MLGGGNFTSQNKILPGSYINFISSSNASVTLSDRGIVAMAMNLNWGADDEVIKIDVDEFKSNSLKLLGYSYEANELKGIRDVFKNAKRLYIYRLNSGNKATNTYATAKCSGIRGNDIKIAIENSSETEGSFIVSTYIAKTAGGTTYTQIDRQDVKNATELKDNDYVTFKTNATLELTAGVNLTGGTNTEEVTGKEYQAALDKFESYTFNVLGCLSTNETIKALFAEYTRRMRDERGSKFQCVLYKHSADYEGVVNVMNKINDSENEADLIYWVSGAVAGCEVNKSCTNKSYDGEFDIDVNYTQAELEKFIQTGCFALHQVNDNINVLKDINSFVTITTEKNADFGLNQVIRVLDQVANDVAVIFGNKYLGKIQNNNAGRTSLWNDIVTYCKELEKIEAIEEFKADEVVVEMGENKTSAVISNAIKPTCAMEQIYNSIVVS